MKNHFAIVALLVICVAVLGCGRLNPFSAKESPSRENTPTRSTSSKDDPNDPPPSTGETSGIAECDEAIDLIDREMRNEDDNFVTRAVKTTALNRIKDAIKKAVEDNKKKADSSDAELVKTCRDFRDQIKKNLAEDRAKGK